MLHRRQASCLALCSRFLRGPGGKRVGDAFPLVVASASKNREQIFCRNERWFDLHREWLGRADIFRRVELRLVALARRAVCVDEDAKLRSSELNRNARRGERHLGDAAGVLSWCQTGALETLE